MKRIASCLVVVVCSCAPQEKCPGATTTTFPYPTTFPSNPSTCPCTSETSPTVPSSPVFTDEEVKHLSGWTARSVTFTPTETGVPIVGDRLAVVFSLGDLSEVEVLSSAEGIDYNSSRSNKTSSIFVSDPYGDDDTDDTTGTDEGLTRLAWDGNPACTELPCTSNGRPKGAASRLLITTGSALDDGRFSLTWGETTPVTELFGGMVAVASAVDYRGHVTILKASGSGPDEVAVTSEVAASALVYNGAQVVWQGQAVPGQPIAHVDGATGESWPKGLEVAEGPVGTEVRLTW